VNFFNDMRDSTARVDDRRRDDLLDLGFISAKVPVDGPCHYSGPEHLPNGAQEPRFKTRHLGSVQGLITVVVNAVWGPSSTPRRGIHVRNAEFTVDHDNLPLDDAEKIRWGHLFRVVAIGSHEERLS